MGETRKFSQIFINFSGPDKYLQKAAALYENDKKMSPDVDQSCVFPSEDGYGEHNGCRRIVDWEETGINDTYRVIFYNSRLKLILAFSLSVQLKLMMQDWRRFINGDGVVKVVHSVMTPHGELTRLSPSQHTTSSKLTRTSTSLLAFSY